MAACNDSIVDTELCTYDTCCLAQGFLAYRPSVAGNATYLAIFVALLLLQAALSLRHRTWLWGAQISCGLALEVIGYGGRLWLHENVFIMSAFLMYLIPLTIAPAFLAGAIYITLGRIVVVYGTHLSPISPRTYTITFVSCDFVSLLLQAIGGAITSSADTADVRQKGVDIMIAGLVCQVVSLAVFAALALDFGRRVWLAKRRESSSSLEETERESDLWHDVTGRWSWKGFLISLALATVLIYIRCVYRVVELWQGFDGAVANDQTTFMVLEGPMIFVAVALLTAFHPGRAFRGRWQEARFAWKSGSNSSSSGSSSSRGGQVDSEENEKKDSAIVGFSPSSGREESPSPSALSSPSSSLTDQVPKAAATAQV